MLFRSPKETTTFLIIYLCFGEEEKEDGEEKIVVQKMG